MILQTTHFSKQGDNDKDKEIGKKSPKFQDSIDLGADGDRKESGKDGKKTLKEPVGPKIELRILPAMYPKMGYDEMNMKMGRRLSPFMSIYRMQLTSMMSIFIRITGFLMAIGVWVFGVSALCCDFTIEALAKKIEECECKKTIFNVAKFLIVLPFAYHMVAGTRHLIWHLNVFLSKPEIYATGYVALALAFVLAVGLTIVKPGDDDKNALKKVDYHGQAESEVKYLFNEKGGRYECIDLSKEDNDELDDTTEP
ncbi:hypothetical protein KR044_004023 [Drosophila immigrans]|nr:hypothetical protein KR044_004023 [Drosophila immigrans]